VPVMDMLPTWTACVGAVLLLRKRAGAGDAPAKDPTPPVQVTPKAPDANGPVVDI
jgi:hypothetical protein